MIAHPDLPATLRVFVRDWLCANHVLCFGRHENVLIDAGHVTRVDETLSLLKPALDGRPLHRLLNTHCHSDHMGGNAAIRRAFGCRVEIPAGEADAIRSWDTDALWLDYAGQQAERFTFDDVLTVGQRLELGERDWDVLAAPGHDMGAVMFWCATERILISGDALWEHGFGIVLPGPGWRERLAAARDTLLSIRALAPEVVIPGHGAPFAGAGSAIERCLSRIAAFEGDEARLARHVLRVMLVYSLLERDGVPAGDAVSTFADIPMFRDYARSYFDAPAGEIVGRLLDELTKSGHATIADGRVTAGGAAG
ncbi:MAG: MBL fold metallo-hydrolase [Burkholderiales bacterium]